MDLSRLYRVTDGPIEPVAFFLTGSVYESGVATGAVPGTAHVKDPEDETCAGAAEAAAATAAIKPAM